MADIEQMFHQIEVKQSDRDALRFVWRNHVTEKIEDYVMNVHLFGKVDSPCCANWALKKSASDQNGNYDDKVIGAVEKDFYMDDFLSLQPIKSEAIELAIQMINLLSTGSFRLTKWISNDRDVIKSLPSTEVSTKIVSLDLKSYQLKEPWVFFWDTENDVLFIKAVLKDLPPTKRGVLSFVSSIFDPIGIVAPAVLEPKLIIQELWRRKIDWDTELPSDLLTRWCKWKSNFKHITNIQIPRWYGFHHHESTNTDLHVFADSSKLAYGAVAYFRAEVNGQICCNFISGKSRLISSLIVKHIHDINLHVGREHTLSLVRELYWITSGKCLTRKVLHDCLYCKRQHIKPQAPHMSDLPKERLAIGEKPFTYTGIDYFVTVRSNQYIDRNESIQY